MEEIYGKKFRKNRKKKFRKFFRIFSKKKKFFSTQKAEPEGDRREPKGELTLSNITFTTIFELFKIRAHPSDFLDVESGG